MAQLIHPAARLAHGALLSQMYRDRKRVFVDRLGWDLEVEDGEERDRFDDQDAEYLILTGPLSGDHLGSLRLLRTDRPHLLDTMFAELCEEELPAGPDVREISRLCLSPRFPATCVADYRAHLATALAEYGLMYRLRCFTAVIETANLNALLARGWECRPLGLPRRIAGLDLLALRIEVNCQVIERLRRAGNYRQHALQHAADVALIAA